MLRGKNVSLAFLGLVACVSSAHAVVTASWVPIEDSLSQTATPDYPTNVTGDVPSGGPTLLMGYETWDLMVTLDAGDKWTVAGLYIPASLLGGVGGFYNAPLGSQGRPNPLLVVPFPATGYDTFVDSFLGGVARLPAVPAGTGGPQDDGSTPPLMNFNLAWGTTAAGIDPAGPTTYPIARLTFKRADPTGPIVPPFAEIYSVIGGGNAPQPIPPIPGIPEPAAVGALCFMSALSIRRRRRVAGRQ